MKKIKIEVNLMHYKSIHEIPAQEKQLLKIAYKQAKQHAHAPYSNFSVGCAVLLENGEILGGSNQENASFPAGICAERTALSACASLYPNVAPKKMAIVMNHEQFQSKTPCAPCGICRQTICEVQNKHQQPIEILFPSENGGFYKAKSIESLLPLMFNSENLNNQ